MMRMKPRLQASVLLLLLLCSLTDGSVSFFFKRLSMPISPSKYDSVSEFADAFLPHLSAAFSAYSPISWQNSSSISSVADLPASSCRLSASTAVSLRCVVQSLAVNSQGPCQLEAAIKHQSAEISSPGLLIPSPNLFYLNVSLQSAFVGSLSLFIYFSHPIFF